MLVHSWVLSITMIPFAIKVASLCAKFRRLFWFVGRGLYALASTCRMASRMAASASTRVPETVQPAAAAWPPPPARAHTFVAFRPPLVRTDSLQPLRQLPDGDGGLHPLNLSQEGGDILHILLSCARLVHEGQGHGGHSDFPALIAVHPLGEQPLHLEPRPALGAEVALVEGNTSMPVSIRAAATRWVSAVVLLY